MKDILKQLCIDKGVSGDEREMFETIRKLLPDGTEVTTDPSGNLIASLGDKNARPHIMLDAHLDRIGLVVTYLNEEGFLKAEPVGGIDLRTLPGAAVRVLGREEILGIVCTVPPHLTHGDEEPSKDKIWVDTGLPTNKVRELVRLGDKIILCSQFTELLNRRVAVSALDNRSGCAVLIRCAQLLRGETLPCRVSLVFSAQEETGELGAGTAAFALKPDEAIVVDVGFARQEGAAPEKSGPLGCGGIISIAPVLSKDVTDKLISLAKGNGMTCAYEVCGRDTGTNADKIASSGCGVRTGVISIPSKNMHTPTELVYLDDMEQIAAVLAAYLREGGVSHA